MPPRLNIPPITRILLITLLALSTLSGVIRYKQWTQKSHIVVPYLTLIPSLSLIYPWTFLTTSLVEGNVFTLGTTGVTLYYGGRYLERAWSSQQFIKFLLIVTLIPNIMCFAILVLMFAITGNMKWRQVLPLLSIPRSLLTSSLNSLTSIAGGIPIQISFLVAFSQLVPAHTVTLFRGIVSLRVPRFPLLYITLIAFLAFTPLMSCASLLLAELGFITSWTYLRFYKPAFPDLDSSQPSGLRGDASETFAFAEFFPGPARAPVSALSNAIYDVLVSLRVCTPFSAADMSASRGDSFLHRNQPGSSRAETERRRALALKALDQRMDQRMSASMTAKTPQPGHAGPSVESQPKPSTQTAMSNQPGSILGETSYNPDGEGEKGSTQA
jgi:hypothetical protein